jgi:hypothetical protein
MGFDRFSFSNYHRAPDGTFVNRNRECFKANGEPKKCFETIEDAERCALAMSVPEHKRGRKYHAYHCTSGHIHVGLKLKQ